MNHDTNREDRIAPFKSIDEYVTFMRELIADAFAVTSRMQQPDARLCISCGAWPDAGSNLPCPCGQKEESC